jgi:hypothetical protein
MYLSLNIKLVQPWPTIKSPLTCTTPFLFTHLCASLVNAGTMSGSETTRKPLVFLIPLPSSQLETLQAMSWMAVQALLA